MKTIVVYKSKYGSTKAYAEWIAEELGCEAKEYKSVKPTDLVQYDAIVYGGGLYAEMIAGINLITKNFDLISDKKLAVFCTGITPIDCREYYDNMVVPKNFKPHMIDKIKFFNYPGKMVLSELSPVHRTALKALKKLMAGKENPSEMEKLLIELCDVDGDFSDRSAIKELVGYIKN